MKVKFIFWGIKFIFVVPSSFWEWRCPIFKTNLIFYNFHGKLYEFSSKSVDATILRTSTIVITIHCIIAGEFSQRTWVIIWREIIPLIKFNLPKLPSLQYNDDDDDVPLLCIINKSTFMVIENVRVNDNHVSQWTQWTEPL